MIRSIAIAAFILLPVYASDIVYPGGGAFTQIEDGAGTQTTITLVNLDSAAASYTLYFFDDNGNPLNLSTTAGAGTSLQGNLPIDGSTTIQTNGGGATILSGWGLLIPGKNSAGNYFTIGGTAVFAQPLPGNPLVEASVPLDTGADTIWVIPFDQTGTTLAGVAVANSWQNTPITVSVSAFGQDGTALFAAPKTIQLAGNGHTSFLLTNYTELTGQKGIVVFTGVPSGNANNTSGWINVLGLRATPTTLTSIIPLVPCLSNGTNCTN